MALNPKQFGTVLKNARMDKKLTQAELAEILDLSLSYLKAVSNNSYPSSSAVVSDSINTLPCKEKHPKPTNGISLPSTSKYSITDTTKESLHHTLLFAPRYHSPHHYKGKAPILQFLPAWLCVYFSLSRNKHFLIYPYN